MANCCFVRLIVTCTKPKELKVLYKLLSEVFKDSEEKHKGAYIGSENKYLFDASCALTNNRLVIAAWVKWWLPRKDFVSVYLYLLEKAPSISSITCTYEEFQTDVIGKYVIGAFQGPQTPVIEEYLSSSQIDDLKDKYTEDFQGPEEEWEQYQIDCRSQLESFPCRIIHKLGHIVAGQPE